MIAAGRSVERRRGARIAAAIAGAALFAFAGCATTGPVTQASTDATGGPAKANPSRSAEECMFSVVVKDWAELDNQRFIIFGLSNHDAYLATVLIPTPDLTNHRGMAVIDDDNNGRICGYSTDAIAFSNATVPGINRITSLHKISDEEARALIADAKKARPGKSAQPAMPGKSPAQDAQAR